MILLRHRTQSCLVRFVIAAGVCAATAHADVPSLSAGPLSPSLNAAYEPDKSETTPQPEKPATHEASPGFTLFGPSGKPYGQAGSKAWTIGAMYANNFHQADDFNGHLAWSNFLADDFEFAVEFAGWGLDRKSSAVLGAGEDDDGFSGGVSGSMVFRWHAWHADDYDWSVFLDAGIGLLWAFDDVPAGGTEFNFLPRVGIGFTKALGSSTDGRAPRLMIGARWHHISNARIDSDAKNPGRDALGIYVGIVFPF